MLMTSSLKCKRPVRQTLELIVAPIINSNAKNSHSNKKSKKVENIKLATKNKSENTGCRATTTIKVLNTKQIEKKWKNIFKFNI